MVFFQNFITTKLMFWGWSPKTPWGFGTPVQLDPKIRKSSGWLAPSGTNKGWPKTPDQQGFFPIRTITTTRTISIQNEHRVSLPFPKAPKTKKKQKRHESSRIKLLVVITSVVKPLPELLPGDRVEVCELRLGGVCLKGRLGTPKIPKNKTGKTREVGHTDILIVYQKKSNYYIIMYLRKEKPRKHSQDFFSLVGLYPDVAFLQGRFNAAQHFTTFNPGITAPPLHAASNTHVHGAGPGSIATRRVLGLPHWKSQSSSWGR